MNTSLAPVLSGHVPVIPSRSNAAYPDLQSVTAPGAWNENLGVIYATLPPTEGRLGPEWSEYFDQEGIPMTPLFKKALWSRTHFVATTGVQYCVAAVRTSLWPAGGRTLANFLHEGLDPNNFSRLNLEAMCLLRVHFSNADLQRMGIQWIAGSHDTIEFDEYPFVASVVDNSAHPEHPGMSQCYAGPNGHFPEFGAIAFRHELRPA
jgi:hypothetical protein